MPDYIHRADKAIAQPAFRILAYWPAGLGDPAVAAGLASIFDLFVEQYRKDLAFIITADEERAFEGKEVDDPLLDDARHWLAAGPKGWPATARVFGTHSDINDEITVPSFRAEQYADLAVMDISVPDNPETAVVLSDKITEILKTMPTLYAVMGMGFFLPMALESLKTYMPRGFVRYKTALEFMADGPRWCIGKDIGNSFWDEFPEATDGIVDIGWRTMLGAYYLPRLGAVSIDAEGVTVEQTDDMLTVTAGPEPIWGDVNKDEDISAYKAVAAALAPARASLRPMLNGLFGNQVDDPDGNDRLEEWYERYED